MSKIDFLRNNKDRVVSLYNEHLNVWKVGELLGVGGGTVHEFLTEIGVARKRNVFSGDDYEFLRNNYTTYRNAGNIQELADKLGRTKQFICRKAKELGLTDYENKISMKPFSSEISERNKKYYATHEHPKGFKNHNHTKEAREKISKSSVRSWKDPNSKQNSEEFKQRQSDLMMIRQFKNPTSRSRAFTGTFNINGKNIFFRSSWEVNIAYYFDFLKNNGEIKEWEYEPDVFWFHEIKRGVRSYKPDFRITENDGTTYFVEVKGYMDAKSITKLKRMKKYYPNIRIDVLDKKRYQDISKKASIIPNWGALNNSEPYNKCSVDICLNKVYAKGFCKKHYSKIYRTNK